MARSVLGIVLAGGRGERLFPLTEKRSKPAVPFGGKYRIIDFVLSNLVNSGLNAIYVLVQFRSQSLIEHLRMAWRLGGRLRRSFITVVPPQMRISEDWYSGTADAVYQNLNLVRDFNPDLVAIFGADHIYRMDIRQMIAFHEKVRADVSVAARPIPVEQARGFGILEADARGLVTGFEEKPEHPRPMPFDAAMAYSSMGNYLFNRDVLMEVLNENARHASGHDFGRDILPPLVSRAQVYAYDFLQNAVPGLQPHEEHGYWRDVGEIESFWRAQMDLLGPAARLDLNNPQWPILGDNYDGPPAQLLSGTVENALIGEGSVMAGARLVSSVLGRGVRVEPGAVIEDSVVMDFCTIGKGARLRKAIVDRFNDVPAGATIGIDPESDRKQYRCAAADIVVVPRGRTRFFV